MATSRRKFLLDGIRTLERKRVFAFRRRNRLPLFGVLVLLLALVLPSLFPQWYVYVTQFLRTNLLFTGALLLALLFLLLWKLPQWQVAPVLSVKDRLDLESKARQTLAQILGGAVLLGGLYYTAQTLRTSQETLQVNQETLRTTQEGQITEGFTKAIDQLGRDNLAMRLGGIYALERIARDSAKDHWQVIEVLTAFVREHQHAGSKPPADIQAILTVVGRRTRTFGNGEMQRLDLRHANLQGAHLAEAQLQQANLAEAQLQQANLQGAQLQQANFAKAQLQGVYLAKAQLQQANLIFAQLQQANFTQAQLQGAQLGMAHLEGANLQQAQLQGAQLGMAHLQGAHLAGVHLQEANLQQAQLKKTYLVGAQLQQAYLGFVELQGADLTRAQLQGADLTGAQLQGADLGFAPTRSSGTGSLAKSIDTHDYRVQLQRADLAGARLQGADLGTAKNLTQEQIDAACVDENTILPEGLTKPSPCPAPQP